MKTLKTLLILTILSIAFTSCSPEALESGDTPYANVSDPTLNQSNEEPILTGNIWELLFTTESNTSLKVRELIEFDNGDVTDNYYYGIQTTDTYGKSFDVESLLSLVIVNDGDETVTFTGRVNLYDDDNIAYTSAEYEIILEPGQNVDFEHDFYTGESVIEYDIEGISF